MTLAVHLKIFYEKPATPGPAFDRTTGVVEAV